MKKKKLFKTIFNVIALSSLTSSLAFASGFQSFEQNASDLGEGTAGAGSVANDATVEFNNPAGLVRIKHAELDVSGVVVDAHAGFKAGPVKDMAGNNVSGSKKQNALGTEVLPAMHLAVPINNRVVFGFGVTIPYGFQTQYSDDSVARYFATKSRIATLNLNPSLGIKINRQWSIGLGVSAQYLKAELNQKIDISSITGSDFNDGTIKNTASNWGTGVNAGILYQLNSNTRFGLSYRSQVFHHLKGKTKLQLPGGLDPSERQILVDMGFKNGDVSADITMPAMTILSGYHAFNAKWATMASLTYTNWSSFEKLALHFTNGYPLLQLLKSFEIPLNMLLVLITDKTKRFYGALVLPMI